MPSSGEIFFGMRDVSSNDSRSFRCDVPERGLSNVIKINVVGMFNINETVLSAAKYNS